MFLDDYMDDIADRVDRFGWVVVTIEPMPGHPPMAYTVGLTDYDLPELAVTGTSSHQAFDLLYAQASQADELLDTPIPGERMTMPDGLRVEAVEVAQPVRHLVAAHDLYGRHINAIQLVRTDPNGRWPWNKRYREGPWPQYLLGPRTKSKNVGGAL